MVVTAKKKKNKIVVSIYLAPTMSLSPHVQVHTSSHQPRTVDSRRVDESTSQHHIPRVKCSVHRYEPRTSHIARTHTHTDADTQENVQNCFFFAPIHSIFYWEIHPPRHRCRCEWWCTGVPITAHFVCIILNAKLRLFSVPMALMFQYLRRQAIARAVTKRPNDQARVYGVRPSQTQIFFSFFSLFLLRSRYWWHDLCTMCNLCENCASVWVYVHPACRVRPNTRIVLNRKCIAAVAVASEQVSTAKKKYGNNTKSNYWLNQYWHRLRFVIL